MWDISLWELVSHGPHDSHISGCDAECLCQTTTCRGRDHTGGRSEMNYALSLLEWWKLASPPWSTDYFSPALLPHGLLPQVGMLPWQSTYSCLSQSSAISPVQAKPIFIALKAAEPNALVLMLQVKIPETVFHLKMDKKMGYTGWCCSPVNYSDMHHYSGEYKKASLFFGVCCK